MLNLHSAFQQIALTADRRAASINVIAGTLALVYRDEINLIPIRAVSSTIGRAMRWERTMASKTWLSSGIVCTYATVLDIDTAHKQRTKLVLFVLRDLQGWGRQILHDDHKLGDDDFAFDGGNTFAPGHAKIIEDTWDAYPTAPVWVAFERQFEVFRSGKNSAARFPVCTCDLKATDGYHTRSCPARFYASGEGA